MIKYTILLDDSGFMNDMFEQIKRHIPDSAVEMEKNFCDDKTKYLFVNEDEKTIKEIKKQHQEILVALFSSTQTISEYADVVIKKPFKLSSFLDSLKENKLFPKVRRKECFCFGEYRKKKQKKEIYSSETKKAVKLTEREVDIIRYLYQINPNSATKEELLEKVWKYNAEATTHTVETHIYRLRQKVEKNATKQLIVTKNNGYKLNT